jgi:Tfp pilus assembly protein PilF
MQDTRSLDRLLCVEELAGLAVLEGRPEVARQLFEHAAGWGKVVTSPRFLRVWGQFECREGNSSASRALFRRATELLAMDVPTWLAWALMERREGNLKECLRLLREVGFRACFL